MQGKREGVPGGSRVWTVRSGRGKQAGGGAVPRPGGQLSEVMLGMEEGKQMEEEKGGGRGGGGTPRTAKGPDLG